jgi:hypothetical protein
MAIIEKLISFCKRKYLAGLVGLLIIVCGCRNPHWTQERGEVRVLFIGNSYTFYNDMPDMFASLIRKAGYGVIVETAAEGGWTLADHAASTETKKIIETGTWDYVVLQEQSIIPSVRERRNREMEPSARILVNAITAVNAQPIIFVTWGRRDGLPEAGFDSFFEMQEQLQLGYTEIAQSLDVALAPVGKTWQLGLLEDANIPLWDTDGSHPSVEGSYLSACVFFAVIVEESPVGVEYFAGLPHDKAEMLQRIAEKTVFSNGQ